MNDVVIVSPCRTAVDDFAGSLSSGSATDLGAIVIKAAFEGRASRIRMWMK